MDRNEERQLASPRHGERRWSPVRLWGCVLVLVTGCDPKPPSTSTESKTASVEVVQVSSPATAATLRLRQQKLAESELSVFVIQDVSDPKVFLDEFRKNKSVRAEAGVVGHQLSKVVDEKNRFVVHYRVASAEKLKTFLDSQEYDRLLAESQATDSLLMWKAKNVLSFSAEGPSIAGATLYKKFPVTDFRKLEGLLSEHATQLAALGLRGISLDQTRVDAAVAILQLRGASPQELKKIYDGPLIQGIFTKAGCRETSEPLIASDLPD